MEMSTLSRFSMRWGQRMMGKRQACCIGVIDMEALVIVFGSLDDKQIPNSSRLGIFNLLFIQWVMPRKMPINKNSHFNGSILIIKWYTNHNCITLGMIHDYLNFID